MDRQELVEWIGDLWISEDWSKWRYDGRNHGEERWCTLERKLDFGEEIAVILHLDEVRGSIAYRPKGCGRENIKLDTPQTQHLMAKYEERMEIEEQAREEARMKREEKIVANLGRSLIRSVGAVTIAKVKANRES